MVNTISDAIVGYLRHLRRYARALTGSQKSGDHYVRLCLEALLQQRDIVTATGDVKLQLFKLFHDVCRNLTLHESCSTDSIDESLNDRSSNVEELYVASRLDALPTPERQVLLLTVLERFSMREAANILDIDDNACHALLADAWRSVNAQIATSILIIEDEPIIALDIADFVQDMGHGIVGIASNHTEAVTMAREGRPGLVLADIDLGAGGSGLEAAREILQHSTVPVIFITAYPERLLTGERPEPAYLITKPFAPDTLRVTISQALSTVRYQAGHSDLTSNRRKRSALA